MPKRIQRKRTKGWRMPENTVYVGRGSKWGNPVKCIPGDEIQQLAAKELYSIWLNGAWSYTPSKREEGLALAEDARKELRGKNLACWCPLDKPCHADVLLELANKEVSDV